MEPVKLNFLLLGKTGQGKSATGNSILNGPFFKEATSQASETKDVDFRFSNFQQQYMLLVVDGPGLEDSDLDKTADREKAIRNMSKALAMCYGGIDAFLLVVKFHNRFSAEDKSAVDALKVIFGDTFMKHVIIVVTCGDLFQNTTDIKGNTNRFQGWCRNQKGEFYNLLKECNNRVILFNNREKDEGKKQAQIQQIVTLTHNLKITLGRYTSQCFQDADREREKLIKKFKVPQLYLQFQEKICLLNAAIENLPTQASIGERNKIKKCIGELNDEIDKVEGEYGVGPLQGLRALMRRIEQNLEDRDSLTDLCQELDKIRRAENAWRVLSPVGFVVGLCLTLAVLTVGPVGAVIGAVALGISSLLYGSKKY